MVEMFDEFVDYVLTDCESTGRPNDLNRVCPWDNLASHNPQSP
jgi:hypothetical protein